MIDPALNLMAQLRRLGVRLAIEGDRLLVDAPRGVVDNGLRGEIRAHKEAIIAALGLTDSRSSRAAAGYRLSDSPEPTRVPISPERLEAKSRDGATQCDEQYDKASSRDHDARPTVPGKSESYADRQWRRSERVGESLLVGGGFLDPTPRPGGQQGWVDPLMRTPPESQAQTAADGLSGNRGSAGWPAISSGLPRVIAELATARPGWTAEAWRGRLKQLAEACKSVNPSRAEALRAAAQLFPCLSGRETKGPYQYAEHGVD